MSGVHFCQVAYAIPEENGWEEHTQSGLRASTLIDRKVFAEKQPCNGDEAEAVPSRVVELARLQTKQYAWIKP